MDDQSPRAASRSDKRLQSLALGDGGGMAKSVFCDARYWDSHRRVLEQVEYDIEAFKQQRLGQVEMFLLASGITTTRTPETRLWIGTVYESSAPDIALGMG
jgi:hypothetical protein